MSVLTSSEQGVWFVGGPGTQADRADDNGGGCSRAWWDGECPNGTQAEFAAAYAKLMGADGGPIISLDDCSYDDDADTIVKTGIHIGVEVGMAAYVIESGTPDTDVTTGRYKITGVDTDEITCDGIAGDSSTLVDIRIGGAFGSLDTAVDDTSATLRSQTIHTNLDETLAASVSVSAGGNNVRNTFKRISGFNTIPGDMSRGGTYYESPCEILRNGSIDNSKCVVLDGDGGNFSILDCTGDNVVVENVHCYNSGTADSVTFTSTPQNIVLRNGRFSAGNSAYASAADYVLFDSCYSHGDMANHHYVASGLRNTLWGCVADLAANKNFVNLIFSDGLVIGCLVGGAGKYGVHVVSTGASALVVNNTFYGLTSYGIFANDCEGVVAYNNIFCLAPGATGLAATTRGSFIYNDYNCFIETDGTPLTVGLHVAGYEAPVIGPHSIAVDPLFVDAANGNLSLQPKSPCVDAGTPDSLDGWATIGAYDFSANRGVSKSRVIGGV